MEPVKAQVDRQQLAEIEKKVGKNYQWHLRNFLLAAKSQIELLPDNANAPTIDAAAFRRGRVDRVEQFERGEHRFGCVATIAMVAGRVDSAPSSGSQYSRGKS